MSEKKQARAANSRRSFFAKLIAGTVGGAALGGVLPNILRAEQHGEAKKRVRVSIHPTAVPRTSKNAKPDGK